jgi:glycosyltransferase involved in cell wall biosynthesis
VRILIAHSLYRRPGGEDRYIRQQIDLLASRHDVHVFTKQNRDLSASTRTAARMIFSPQMQAEVGETIERYRPEVIHLHNPYPALGPAIHLSARKHRVPLVQTVHNLRLRCPNGFMFTEGQVCRRCEKGMYVHSILHRCFETRKQAAAYASALWAHRFMLGLERDVALYVAPSDFMKQRLLHWGFPSDRVRVIRNFVEPHLEASSDPGVHGIFVGRLSSEKGLETLLTALKQAGDPRFLVVGEGPMKDRLLDSARSTGLKNVRFLGWQEPEKVRELLRQSRYQVVPSLSEENAPLAALEALAAGRPLIASNIGGLPELVEEGAGLAVRADDAHALAVAIQRLINDPELCRQMGLKALGFAQSHLSPEEHLASLEEAYGGVI